MKELIEDDGENRAVRGFLLGPECGIKSSEEMKGHMKRYGTPYWPEYFNTVKAAHLTKFDKQEWLRYLFNLEKSSPTSIVKEALEQMHSEGDENDKVVATKALNALVVEEPTHRYVLELPAGNEREAKVYWSERSQTNGEITHRLCISIEEKP